MELLFGEDVEYVPKGTYGAGLDKVYYEFNLPVSECGKYILIKIPIGSRR